MRWPRRYAINAGGVMIGFVFYCVCLGMLRGVFHWRWQPALLLAGPLAIGALALGLLAVLLLGLD